MSDTPIETEIVDQTQALAIRPDQRIAQTGLFGTNEPEMVIAKATSIATALRDVLERQGLISVITGKKYPKCEAWTLLGTMLGVFPVLVWSRPIEGGWEARVEARTKDGSIVGAAEAQCLKTERNWSNRDDFALRSMAQTRATAKCLRMPLGFVMTLAGYQPTPAEEMVTDHPQSQPPQKPPGQAAGPARSQQPAPPVKAAASPKSVATSPVILPTVESRAKMIAFLEAGPGGASRDIVTEYFQHMSGLMPNEPIEDLPLRFCPATTSQMRMLSTRIRQFGDGMPAEPAFPAHSMEADAPPKKEKATAKPIEVPRDTTSTEPPQHPAEWFFDIVIPVPRKGQKRDEYLKHPDTIGSLYDLRHGTDDEAAAARQRLWGFVENWEPKGWQGNPPSAGDIKAREALDAFKEWFEKNHPDEKL